MLFIWPIKDQHTESNALYADSLKTRNNLLNLRKISLFLKHFYYPLPIFYRGFFVSYVNEKTFFFLIINYTPHLFSHLLFFDLQNKSYFLHLLFLKYCNFIFVTVNFVPSYRFLLYKKELTKIQLYKNKRS